MSSSTTPLRLGTRGSDLALTQSTTVAHSLTKATGRAVELVRIRTEGDRSTASLASLGGTGVFAAALREALLAGECDIAVHSLKDLPTAPISGLSIGAVPERADHRDVLCARDGRTLTALPLGARVGTGSPRRAAQLRLARPDLEVVDIRGNVGTRLARVGTDLDAVVLARAGLARLGLLEQVTDTLEGDVMLPAPGQGALAVECRAADLRGGGLADALRLIDHPPSRLAVLAERAVLRTLEAGCAAPVGAYAFLVTSGDAPARLELRAGVFAPDGSQQIRRTASVELPPHPGRTVTRAERDGVLALAGDLGIGVAEQLLADGAADIAGLPRTRRPDGAGAAGGDGGAATVRAAPRAGRPA